MKKMCLLILFSLVLLASCSLFEKKNESSAVYVLDWSSEAIFVIDSFLNAGTSPLIITGDGPSDIVVDDSSIYVSNSGFGGIASVEKFNFSGERIAYKETGENSSPGFLYVDENYLVMSLWLSNKIVFLDKNTFEESHSISVLAPQEITGINGVLYTGSNNVGDSSSILIVYDDSDRRDLKVGSNPSYLDLNSKGELFVSCVGNYGDIKGKVVKVVNDAVAGELKFNTFLGKIKCVNNYVLVMDYMANVFVLDRDLNILDTIYINSPSDIEVFKNHVLIGTNMGKMYVSDTSDVTKVDSTSIVGEFKVSEFFVK